MHTCQSNVRQTGQSNICMDQSNKGMDQSNICMGQSNICIDQSNESRAHPKSYRSYFAIRQWTHFASTKRGRGGVGVRVHLIQKMPREWVSPMLVRVNHMLVKRPVKGAYGPVKCDYKPVKCDYKPVKCDYKPVKNTGWSLVQAYLTHCVCDER